MITRLRRRLPGHSSSLLDLVLVWSGSLLIIAAVAFAAYYYFDQRGVGGTSGSTLLDRELARLEQAVRDSPGDAVLRVSLAEAYLSASRPLDAVAQFQAALDLDATRVDAIVGLGRAYMAAGDHASARPEFEKVVEMASQGVMASDIVETARYYLGEVALLEQQPGEAVTHLEAAVAIDSSDADAWRLLGKAYRESGDIDKAIEALSRAVLFVPNYQEAYEELALAYDQKGLVGEAQYARGMVAYCKRDYGKAVRQLKDAVEASPAFANGYAGLGLALEGKGEREEAVAAFQKALELDSGNIAAQFGLARLGALPAPGAAFPHPTVVPEGVNP